MKSSRTQEFEISNSGASSRPRRSLKEHQKIDLTKNEDVFLSCSKILEETEEESAANLTPRLANEVNQESNPLEDIKSTIQVRKSMGQDLKSGIYASRTTLETEGSSQNNYELESTSTLNERENRDSALDLSNISSEGMSIEDRFCSPINAGRSSVPALNFSKIRKGVNSLNSSCISTTNASVAESRFDKRLGDSPNLDSTLSSITQAVYRGSGVKPSHYKNRLSHGKLTTNTLTKGARKSSSKKAATTKHNRKHSEDYEVSWKSKNNKISGDGFKKTHWNFSKKSKGKDTLAD